jgi:putative endonuclease
MHYVYVLQSETDQGLYIGYTADLRRRLKQHQAGESRSTSRRRPWGLIYYEAYVDELDARGREKFLKAVLAGAFSRNNAAITLGIVPSATFHRILRAVWSAAQVMLPLRYRESRPAQPVYAILPFW